MATNKLPWRRYQIIDKLINNKFRSYPTMSELIDACEKELDQKFSVSTIQKDIESMKNDSRLNLNAPIKFSKSKNGYYYSDENYSINSLPLNEQEIEALELAACVIDKYKGTGIGGSFNMAVGKVMSFLKTKKIENDEKAKNIIFPEKNLRFRGTEQIDFLVHCIKAKIPISFIHFSYKDHIFKSCVLHPYFLKEHHSRWYLVGYSEMHKCIRIFGLDRIEDIVSLKKAFHKIEGWNAEEMFKNSIGVYISSGIEIPEIQSEFSNKVAGYIKTQSLHDSQEIIEYKEDGGIIISIKVNPDEEFMQMILSYGANAFIISPVNLRVEVEDRHKSAVENSFFKTKILRKRNHESNE